MPILGSTHNQWIGGKSMWTFTRIAMRRKGTAIFILIFIKRAGHFILYFIP